jgi:hypothetical protein
MASVQAQIAELGRQVAAQATQIARLNKEVQELRARLPCQPPFDVFPKLPPEVRRLIWRCALPGPRLVTVVEAKRPPGIRFLYIDRCDGSGPQLAFGFSRLEEQPVGPPPPLFHVCRESRQVALESYKFCFSTRINSTSLLTEEIHSYPRRAGQPVPPYKPPVVRPVQHADRTWTGVCFQSACDTIYLRRAGFGIWEILTSARAEELETGNIRSLAVSFECYEMMPRWFLGLHAPFFSGLTELIIVAEEDAEAERIRVPRAGVSACRKSMADVVRRVRAGHPSARVPTVKVMTDAMLNQSMASTGGLEI